MPEHHSAPPATTPKARSSRASGRITMQDVAQAVGVSTMTVSRALRQSSHVEPQLRQRIQATAQAMGYVPDPAARALASQKSTQVLVLLPSLANPRLAQLLEALHAVLYPAGYHTLIGITHDDSTHLHQLLQSYLPLRPAGLLLTGEIQHPQTRQLLASHPTPCVQMLALPPCPDIPCVGFSPAAAGAAMTSHLLAQGRRRIAFAASQHHAHRMPLEQGWRHTLQAAGLYQAALALQHPAPASPDVGAQLLHTALATSTLFSSATTCWHKVPAWRRCAWAFRFLDAWRSPAAMTYRAVHKWCHP